MPEGKDVYVSGFGDSGFIDDKTNKIMCWTNSHGPSRFKRCRTSCRMDKPPSSQVCEEFQHSEAYNISRRNHDRGFNVLIGDKNDLCFYEPGAFGWCQISKQEWGYCSYHCSLSNKLSTTFLSNKMQTALMRYYSNEA